MRLKFLTSLMLTFSFFACAKDQAAEGPNEALSQDQADGSADQDTSNDNDARKDDKASANTGAETPAAPPSDAPLSGAEDTPSTNSAGAPLDGTSMSADADTEPSDTTDPLDDATAALPEAPAAEAPAEQAPTAEPEAPPVVAEPTTPAEQSAPSAAPASQPASGRIVRYVMRDNTAIMLEPQQGAQQVGTLSKGDSVLIEDQGEFGKIGEGKFVSKKALSEKIISREKTKNPWK